MRPSLLLLSLLVSEIAPSTPWVGTEDEARLRPSQSQGRLVFEWHDAEDVVRGSITPARPRAGEALSVELSVEPMAGAPYEGSVSVVLRPLEQTWGGELLTMRKPEEGRFWRFAPVPRATGPHLLELRWQTTGPKVLRAELDVGEATLPPWSGPLVAALVIALVGGVSAALFLRGQRAEQAHRAAATAPLPDIARPAPAAAEPPGRGPAEPGSGVAPRGDGPPGAA